MADRNPIPKTAYETLSGPFFGGSTRTNTDEVDPALAQEFLQSRLDASTPYDRFLYESFGLEPGLDRATFLPYATGPDGENQLALPGLAYEALKAANMPGAAMQSVPISDEEVAMGAMELTGGGLTTGSVPVTATETLLGMAARPKGAFMRPTSTYGDPDSVSLPPGNPEIENPVTGLYGGQPSNIPEYEKSLEINLIAQGVDEDVATKVSEKATKYFMKEFGTADDRLRQGLLKNDIEPDFYLGPPPFFPPALAQKTALYSNLEKARQGDPAAREMFERDYDRATGLQRTIVDASVDPFDPLPAEFSEAQKMLDEGVPPSLIPDVRGGRTGGLLDEYSPLYLESDVKTQDEFLKTLPGKFRRYDAEAIRRFEPLAAEPSSLLRSTAPELTRAMDQGDMIYSIDDDMMQSISQGLDFLSPDKLAQDLSNLSNKQLEKASFPDLVIQAKNAIPTPDATQRKTARELSAEDARRNNRNENAQTADERNAAVPTELKTEVGVTSYLTPNNDKTWYSVDTDAALQLDGGLMKHSIGGYAKNGNYAQTKKDDFAAGDIKVFSLREKDGQPRVTTDIGYRDASMVFRESGVGKPFVIDAYGYNNKDVRNEDLKDLFALWEELGIPSGPRADPKGVLTDGVTGEKLGKGEQYAAYLQTGKVFSLQDAQNFLGRENSAILDVPDLPEDFSGGGIVSLANGGPVEHGIVTL